MNEPTYIVVQHSWGFEVRNLDLNSTVATYRQGKGETFSLCRTLAESLADHLNRELKKGAA